MFQQNCRVNKQIDLLFFNSRFPIPFFSKRPVSDKPCYPDRVWEAPVVGGLSIVTGLASGSNSSNLEFGQVGSFSRESLSQAKGSMLFSLAVSNKV